MIDITLADFSHKKELAKLWVEVFGDDENFISSFLDAYMIPEYNVPIITNGKKIISALYLIDFPLYSNMKNLGDCAYLFAAATKKEYRNKGHMSKLISYSSELCKNRGLKAIFLFPQNQKQELFDFYSKSGFESIYAAKKIKLRSDLQKDKDLAGFKLVNKNITDTEIFDGLYNSYAEYTAKQELAPMKDRFFYFKCASSYLDMPENSEITAHFAVFENNVVKFCYVFYKKYKNTYYIDDIILLEYSNIRENVQQKYDDIINILSDFILNQKNNVNLEMSVPQSSSYNGENIPLAMILPLDNGITEIIRNLKTPVYINMFMNI